MINNIEGQSKAELIKTIECQQEHDQQREEYILYLQADNERLKTELYKSDVEYQKIALELERSEQRAESLERERGAVNPVIYTLDGYFQDYINKDYGSAEQWLRHVRSAYEKYYNEDLGGASPLQDFANKQQIKALEDAREPLYKKEAYMFTDYGLCGSTCKRIVAWLDDRIEQLRNKEGE